MVVVTLPSRLRAPLLRLAATVDAATLSAAALRAAAPLGAAGRLTLRTAGLALLAAPRGLLPTPRRLSLRPTRRLALRTARGLTLRPARRLPLLPTSG
ncbi:hypothetical protein AB0J83_16995, partial [Actinoplanes sp. NPDC049596]|uniref:hypothetical protein n=1 Tax=Actinoplanes sp. NPDC049596 TaxID=3154625 RepID=UPI0034191383